MADPLITTTELGDYLGRNLSSDNGADLVVDMASDVCRTVAEQTFTPLTDTAVLDGTGTDCVLLPEVPVNTVGTVVVNGVTAGTLDYVATTDGKLFRTDGTANFSTWETGWAWCRGGTAIWPEGRQNISVTYNHGYLDGTVVAVPDDVRMVALALASRLIFQGPAKEETLGDQSVKYGMNASDLTNTEKAILRKYKQAK